MAVQTSSILAVSTTLPISHLLQLGALVKVSIAYVVDENFPLAGPELGNLIPTAAAASSKNLYLSRLRTIKRVQVCQDKELKVLQFVELLLFRFCFICCAYREC
jgi:hypothetical protein